MTGAVVNKQKSEIQRPRKDSEFDLRRIVLMNNLRNAVEKHYQAKKAALDAKGNTGIKK